MDKSSLIKLVKMLTLYRPPLTRLLVPHSRYCNARSNKFSSVSNTLTIPTRSRIQRRPRERRIRVREKRLISILIEAQDIQIRQHAAKLHLTRRRKPLHHRRENNNVGRHRPTGRQSASLSAIDALPRKKRSLTFICSQTGDEICLA